MCVPGPSLAYHQTHRQAPSSGLVLWHHTPWRGAKSFLWACLCSLCIPHIETHVLCWQATASSLHLPTGCPRQLWMKEQGCAELGCVPNPPLSSCLHPTVVPTQAELRQRHRGPGSSQTSCAEPPAHRKQTRCIHKGVPPYYLKRFVLRRKESPKAKSERTRL